MAVRYCIFPTRMGYCGIAASQRGLRRVYLPEKTAANVRAAIQRDFAGQEPIEDRHILPELAAALRDYFEGKAVEFQCTIDWGDAHRFEVDVWRACSEVGYGRTTSYGALAERLGRPGGARAVGSAMAHNPLPIVVPCHRVLKSDGSLGGYSGNGGVALKQALLDMEAAATTAVV